MSLEQYINRRLSDEDYMQLALNAAERARSIGDIPVGALLVWSDSHIADHNTIHSECDYTNHAELNVMRKASEMKFKRLKHATLYCTVEPCIMCAAAAHCNGIAEIVFGAYDPQNGFLSSRDGIICESYGLQHKGGVLAEQCFELLPPKMKEFIRIEP